MLNIAICDDNFEDLDIEKEEVSKALHTCKNKAHVECFTNGNSLIQRIDEGWNPNIVILDIEMPEIDGISVAEKIRHHDNQALLIYVSFFDQYCKDLINTQPFAFVDKPIDEKKMANVLKDAINNTVNQNCTYSFCFNHILYNIEYKKILWFESQRRVVNIHCADNSVYSFYEKLDKVEEELEDAPVEFIRVSKSTIVNVSYIRVLQYDYVELMNGKSFSISRKYWESVKENYIKRMRKKC